MFAEAQHRGGRSQHLLENAFALDEHDVTQIVAVQIGQVEYKVRELHWLGSIQSVLQGLKTGSTIGHDHRDLAVEPRAFDPELLGSLCNRLHRSSPILAVPGVDCSR